METKTATEHLIDEHGRTLLWIACYEGNLKQVQTLHSTSLTPNILVRQPDYYQRTPMYIATSQGHLHIITYLHQNGAAEDFTSSVACLGISRFNTDYYCAIHSVIQSKTSNEYTLYYTVRGNMRLGAIQDPNSSKSSTCDHETALQMSGNDSISSRKQIQLFRNQGPTAPVRHVTLKQNAELDQYTLRGGLTYKNEGNEGNTEASILFQFGQGGYSVIALPMDGMNSYYKNELRTKESLLNLDIPKKTYWCNKSKKFVSRDVFPPPTKQRPAGGVSLRPRILLDDSPLEEAAQSSRVEIIKWAINYDANTVSTGMSVVPHVPPVFLKMKIIWVALLKAETNDRLVAYAVHHRDVDYESFICFLTIVYYIDDTKYSTKGTDGSSVLLLRKHHKDSMIIKNINEYLQGTLKTCKAWKGIYERRTWGSCWK